MKLFSLLETKYNNFTSSVKDYLSKALSDYGDNYGNSTVFGQLINVLSGVVQNVMMYLEDALVEQNKWTAQRKKSVYGLAAQTGYKPDFGSATGVQIKLNFTPTNQQMLNVIIRNREPLTCTQNGLNYNIILPQESIVLDVSKDPSTKYLYAVQGTFDSQSFTANGGPYYTQNFKFVGNLDVKYMYVYVNNELWEYVPSLYDMNPLGHQYTYQAGYYGGIDLIFGNGVHGQQLYSGDVIRVVYLIHDGELGNLNGNTNTYFIFNENLGDIAGNSTDGNNIFIVTMATNDGVTSGSNSESIENVRSNIGYNSRSLVFASPENYKHFLSKFSFVGYNRTWSEPGSLIVNTLAMKNYQLNLNNNLDYYNLTESDFLLTDTQKNSIINAVKENGNQLAGITYNIIDPEICKYFLTIYVKLKSNKYDKLFVESEIRKVVADFFINVENDQFIPKSDIEKAILDKVEGVDGLNCYFISKKNEDAIQSRQYVKKTYVWDPLHGRYDIKTETVYLYPGENPNLGLDSHGNILLESDYEYPVLMQGWDWLNDQEQEVDVTDPLSIIFE